MIILPLILAQLVHLRSANDLVMVPRIRGLSQIIFPAITIIMTLRGGGSEGLGCDANILFKAHLDFGR